MFVILPSGGLRSIMTTCDSDAVFKLENGFSRLFSDGYVAAVFLAKTAAFEVESLKSKAVSVSEGFKGSLFGYPINRI